MKVSLRVIPLMLIVILLFTGCSTTDTYESLYDEYCTKITDISPIILEEFKTEAEPIKDDSQALSNLYNKKWKSLQKFQVNVLLKWVL